jgi:hypothetical protein
VEKVLMTGHGRPEGAATARLPLRTGSLWVETRSGCIA